MSDLQCPATIVLLTENSVAASELRELRLALVALAADGGDAAAAGARHLAGVHSCEVDAVSCSDAQALAAQVDQLADSYRGESVALVAREQVVCAALKRKQAPSQPIVLAVDSSGWNVLSG